MNKLFAVALGAAVLASPALAGGADPFAAPRAVVHTADLDLASAEGQARLDQRIARAADRVCGSGTASIHLAMAAKARDCRIATAAGFGRTVQSASLVTAATVE